ncbi:MAG: hypothetical protein KAS62_08505 [Candidatus Delongbacteria bacterium]|nr:hypothetical protein [Candidatus Delongbacteria bacterium]
MKIKILIITAFTTLLLWSCTPEVEGDQLTIYSQNNSVFEQYYSTTSTDTNVVLVKSRYSSFPYRNNVSLGDTSYSANTLFFQFDRDPADGSRIWFCSDTLDSDSNLYVTEWDEINRKIYIRYDDTLVFVKYLRDASLDTTIVDTAGIYTNIESFDPISEVDSVYIDSINVWYKTYDSWKDDMINLYR